MQALKRATLEFERFTIIVDFARARFTDRCVIFIPCFEQPITCSLDDILEAIAQVKRKRGGK